MDERNLAGEFQTHAAHLRAVAYRMLGSLAEADDAVQEAWLHLGRGNASEAAGNLRAWLTTVVARTCLDMLRARKSRREDFDARAPEVAGPGPDEEALIAESVGQALLVVLEHLDPAERIAFVLHDMFDRPFDEIASIVARSPEATRKLASRARRRVRGAPLSPDLARQREVVAAYLAAARAGDLDALLAVLVPEVVVRADRAVTSGEPIELRGALAAAKRAIQGGARGARVAMVNGEIGVVVAPRGRLMLVLALKFAGDKIVEIDAIGEPETLAKFELSLLGEG
jgi:RNA polymerase sigma-70 factor (ECF subfamily)